MLMNGPDTLRHHVDVMKKIKYTHRQDNDGLWSKVRKYNMLPHHRYYYNDTDMKWYRYDGNPTHEGEVERWADKKVREDEATKGS